MKESKKEKNKREKKSEIDTWVGGWMKGGRWHCICGNYPIEKRFLPVLPPRHDDESIRGLNQIVMAVKTKTPQINEKKKRILL